MDDSCLVSLLLEQLVAWVVYRLDSLVGKAADGFWLAAPRARNNDNIH
jgi:hypothetical protein